MKFLALSALLLAASASAKAPKHHELDESYDFATYVKDFSKSYAPEEYARREALFQANLKDIMQHNQLLGRTYHKGVNHFTDFAEEEVRQQTADVDTTPSAAQEQKQSDVNPTHTRSTGPLRIRQGSHQLLGQRPHPHPRRAPLRG